MAPKLVRITPSSPFKMQSGMAYRIELPQGLTEEHNREWLESFVESLLIKKGLVLDYRIESNQGNSKNYLHITVRELENERNFRIENSPAPLINSSQEEQKISQKSVKKRRVLRNLRYWGVTTLIGVPLWILTRFLEITSRNKFLSFLMGYLIMQKLAPVIMKYFGTSLPGWVKFYLSLFM